MRFQSLDVLLRDPELAHRSMARVQRFKYALVIGIAGNGFNELLYLLVFSLVNQRHKYLPLTLQMHVHLHEVKYIVFDWLRFLLVEFLAEISVILSLSV